MSGIEIRFALPSEPRYLAVIRGAIAPLAAAMGWPESDCLEITLALDEAIANVIRHAYHSRCDGRIELQCREAAGNLEFTLIDHGDPPDPARICAGDPAGTQPGGRGTHIIRKVMDHVCYESTPHGNRFVASKSLRKTL